MMDTYNVWLYSVLRRKCANARYLQFRKLSIDTNKLMSVKQKKQVELTCTNSKAKKGSFSCLATQFLDCQI